MLVLSRRDGQWIEIVHRSGDVIRFRVYGIRFDDRGANRVNLVFDDGPRNFEVNRPDRVFKGTNGGSTNGA